MAAAPKKLTFLSWQRSKLFARAKMQGERLGSSLSLRLTDTNTGQFEKGEAGFTLMSAADIAGLQPGAIKHMAPAPFSRDAETTKFAHVDFWDAGLPWRYTPRVNHPVENSPWLVLLVGTAKEIQVAGNAATVQNRVLSAHDLVSSHLWAHVQSDGQATISRLLSPRRLQAQSEYIAVVVPAFNEHGETMWTVIQDGNPDEEAHPVVPHFGDRGYLPAFHAWRFWTAEAGDFETLATALKIPEAGEAGKARLHYRRKVPANQVDIDLTLEARGAITSLQLEDTPQADELDRVISDLDVLNDALPDTIGMPHYGRPWIPDPDDMPSGWAKQLNDDPRYRGIAGLGTWMGVEAQEALMNAAVQQAGALREAGQRIGNMALGIWAAGRLWERRLPGDKNERLRILGPIMGRMLAAGGGLVLDQVTSEKSLLSPGLFSSAAQRLLRPRSPHTRHLTDGLNHSLAMEAANRPIPPQDERSLGLPTIEKIADKNGLPRPEALFRIDDAWLEDVLEMLREILLRVSSEYRQERDQMREMGLEQDIPRRRREIAESLDQELTDRLDDRIAEIGPICTASDIMGMIGRLVARAEDEFFLEWTLEDDAAQHLLLDELREILLHCMAELICPEVTGHLDIEDRFEVCKELVETIPSEPLRVPTGIHLGPLSDAVSRALDPRRPDAPARVRLCSRIEGIDCTRLVPPEYPIGLDFPTWDLLKKYDKEWLLPGAGQLEKDSITALQTNPAFIDAYMLGINTQFMSEMRWRDLAVERTCTPLRMFWGPVNYATQRREADITPLLVWTRAPDDPLGALSHQAIPPDDASNTEGSRLVIAFHSDLFRRYPSTLVYLVRPAVGDDVDSLLQSTPLLDIPEGEPDPETWRVQRRFFGPIFAGTITPELTFFAFDVKPSKLGEYWLVLDEPPAELRFRNDQPRNNTNSAEFAKAALDQPTRVAISGAELLAQGLDQ
jgi:hypothetical protein